MAPEPCGHSDLTAPHLKVHVQHIHCFYATCSVGENRAKQPGVQVVKEGQIHPVTVLENWEFALSQTERG